MKGKIAFHCASFARLEFLSPINILLPWERLSYVQITQGIEYPRLILGIYTLQTLCILNFSSGSFKRHREKKTATASGHEKADPHESERDNRSRSRSRECESLI